jgi:hypothetical protein
MVANNDKPITRVTHERGLEVLYTLTRTSAIRLKSYADNSEPRHIKLLSNNAFCHVLQAPYSNLMEVIEAHAYAIKQFGIDYYNILDAHNSKDYEVDKTSLSDDIDKAESMATAITKRRKNVNAGTANAFEISNQTIFEKFKLSLADLSIRSQANVAQLYYNDLISHKKPISFPKALRLISQLMYHNGYECLVSPGTITQTLTPFENIANINSIDPKLPAHLWAQETIQHLSEKIVTCNDFEKNSHNIMFDPDYYSFNENRYQTSCEKQQEIATIRHYAGTIVKPPTYFDWLKVDGTLFSHPASHLRNGVEIFRKKSLVLTG